MEKCLESGTDEIVRMVDVPRERRVLNDGGFDAETSSDTEMGCERSRAIRKGELDVGREAHHVGAVAVAVRDDGDPLAEVDHAKVGRMWEIRMGNDQAGVPERTKMIPALRDRPVEPRLDGANVHGATFVRPPGHLGRVVDDENIETGGGRQHGLCHRGDQHRSIGIAIDRGQPKFAGAERTQRDQDSSRTDVTSIRLRKAHVTSLGFATMRSLREVLRPTAVEVPTASTPPRSWNTLSTIGAGSVADVDGRGVIFPRTRPLSVEVWFGAGDRWVQGGADAGVRQSRIVGLPIIETRQRVGDSDIVQTAWADESGDARGRIIVELKNETDVAVVAAVVVRPQRIVGGAGSISEARIADTLIVADRLPIVDLTRQPGDVAVAVDEDTALLDLLRTSTTTLLGHDRISDDTRRASIAAMIPLTPGMDRQIHVLDGREASTVAAAPLDRIVAGWRLHLDGAMEIELPGWPKHMPPALLSSLIGAVADDGPPLGSASWQRSDDAAIAVALGSAGVHWAAAAVAERLLIGVAEGVIPRPGWPQVAAALCAISGSTVGDEVIARHGDTAVTIAGDTLTSACGTALDSTLVDVVRVAHGAAAANDARSIVGRGARPETLRQLGRLGVSLGRDNAAELDAALDDAEKPFDLCDVALAMVASAQTGRTFNAVVPTRALAGSTWRWAHDGCGDSPHARAAIAIGLRALCVATSDDVIDIVPAMSSAWLGQNLRVARMPTPAGLLSYAIRWHGPRPALLWELTGDAGTDFSITCASIDPSFRTSDRTGEALLEEPTHLVGS